MSSRQAARSIDDPKRAPLLTRVLSPFDGRFRLWLHKREVMQRDVLGPLDDALLASWLRSGDQAWAEWTKRIGEVSPPVMTGSINPGEQRALFALVAALRPKRILEVGTHVGGSTIALAAALESNADGSLVTVDVLDVNSPERSTWPGTQPGEVPQVRLKRLGLSHRVSFVRASALELLRSWSDPLDLVFLDGSHEPQHVYAEMARVSHHLRAPGYVILHDYFPNRKTIGATQNFVPGRTTRCSGYSVSTLGLGHSHAQSASLAFGWARRMLRLWRYLVATRGNSQAVAG